MLFQPIEVYAKANKFIDIGVELPEVTKKWKEFSRANLTLGEELGSGAFGEVFKGTVSDNEEEKQKIPCAVKMLKGLYALK